eukprot:6957862-Pyramimonas_sp.AAC.1
MPAVSQQNCLHESAPIQPLSPDRGSADILDVANWSLPFTSLLLLWRAQPGEEPEVGAGSLLASGLRAGHLRRGPRPCRLAGGGGAPP